MRVLIVVSSKIIMNFFFDRFVGIFVVVGLREGFIKKI